MVEIVLMFKGDEEAEMESTVRNGRRRRRTNRDDSLVEAVGWRLFKADEIPSRLRRLEAMERTAEMSPVVAPKDPAAPKAAA
jgi:hypothetical protein